MGRTKKRPDARRRRRSRAGARERRHRDELLGIGLLFIGGFLMLSLYTYNATDGDLFIHVSGQEPSNGGGRIGATLAALSFQLVGIFAYLGAMVVIIVGFHRVCSRLIPSAFNKSLCCATMLVAGCVLAQYTLPVVSLGTVPSSSGGLLGLWAAATLDQMFGASGGPMAAVAAMLIAVVALTKLSLTRLIGATASYLAYTARRLRTAWAHANEQRRKRRQRRNVIAKYSARTRSPAAEPITPGSSNPAPETNISQDKRPLLTLKVPVVPIQAGAPVPGQPPQENMAVNSPLDELALISEFTEAEPKPLPFEQPAGPDGSYALPPIELIHNRDPEQSIDREELKQKAEAITTKAAEFNVNGEIVAIHPGPVVTTFEFRPGPGVKYSRITNLQDDLSLTLRAETIRIARLAGRATVGIEVPNHSRAVISLREILGASEFASSQSKLTLALGKQIHGETMVSDLARMPHLLIAGTTGSGKSVALNCMLLSLLYKATPDEVKLVLIDPKRLEFGLYEDIPHLLTPVVVEPKLAANALTWAVREMERRYRLLAEYGVRNIGQFNLILQRGGEELAAGDDDEAMVDDLKPLPYVVIIIDELADLMMSSSAVVEGAIIRLSQMARAVGIHLILATQRPSVDVITGVIKNNLPSRISFRVASKVDSRVILDTQGAEGLLGKGDMLFLAVGTSRLARIHGAYVGESEVKRVVNFWRGQARPAYENKVTEAAPEVPAEHEARKHAPDRDEMYDAAVRLVLAAGEASISNIQRKLRVGYARAGRIVDMMEEEGIVGPPGGSKPRRILMDPTRPR